MMAGISEECEQQGAGGAAEALPLKPLSACTILPWANSGPPRHQGSCGCPRAGWYEAAVSAVRFPLVPLRPSACICLINRPLTSLGNHGGFAGPISFCLPIVPTSCPR
jgi:hypothetical protein